MIFSFIHNFKRKKVTDFLFIFNFDYKHSFDQALKIRWTKFKNQIKSLSHMIARVTMICTRRAIFEPRPS